MIEALLFALALYLAVGALFAGWFCLSGVRRIDPHAHEGSRGFRILIWPGATLLWPLLWKRVLDAKGHPPGERTAHRLAARRNRAT
jgi:hypothetical protein